MQAALPPCFGSCSTCNLHTVGRWVPREKKAPYRLNHSLWATMGLSGPPSSSPQHYGMCDDVHGTRASTPRALFEWRAEQCDLPLFDRERACALLRGKQVVVAGDSTAGQIFLSLVLMLGGSFGRNSRHTSAISDVTASACEDTCRINFIRNDLLLWTTHRSDFNRARECDKLLKADAFVQRTARDAHILVLATGHHFPASMEAAALAGGGTAGRASSFITGSLNHTLFNLRRARARYGHAPESVALIGTSIPVPSCSRFSGTLEAADWLRVEASMAGGSKYTPRWRQMHRINALLRWLAEAHGASFVDIAAPSSRWPGALHT
jgi:hypothetical protein